MLRVSKNNLQREDNVILIHLQCHPTKAIFTRFTQLQQRLIAQNSKRG